MLEMFGIHIYVFKCRTLNSITMIKFSESLAWYNRTSREMNDALEPKLFCTATRSVHGRLLDTILFPEHASACACEEQAPYYRPVEVCWIRLSLEKSSGAASYLRAARADEVHYSVKTWPTPTIRWRELLQKKPERVRARKLSIYFELSLCPARGNTFRFSRLVKG